MGSQVNGSQTEAARSRAAERGAKLARLEQDQIDENEGLAYSTPRSAKIFRVAGRARKWRKSAALFALDGAAWAVAV